MTAILGISAYYHDSAAALVVDGKIVAAAQEERFTRKKHDSAFPVHAVQYCLSAAGLDPGDLDYVGFYDKPLLKFERLLETYLSFAPAGFRSFLAAMPLWLREKLYLPREMRKGLSGRYRKRFVFTEHHESHAASAFFPSPFSAAAILTMDGVGEWATASWGTGQGNRIALSQEIRFPHSLGLLYSAFTYFCGFRVNSGEYKLMGLAPYGEPTLRDAPPREADRPQSGRLIPPGFVVLQLLPGVDDDFAEIRPLVRRSSAQAGSADRAARNGHRGFDPARHGRCHAACRAARASNEPS